ncbi:MAG TPA: exodeoxyribonuclease III, partial [Candidatus Ventricola intestinavium]|nr:exodeoxyribonuclease III [Candidatus Ventricola intestinavium]
EIDLKNPKTNVNNAGFTKQEREAMTRLLESGFVDTFRYLHPDATGCYSWWSYMFNARKNNAGWRIDYFLVSERIRDRILDARIDSDILGSDHCPVVLEIDL